MEGSIKNNFQEPVHYIAVRPKLLSKKKRSAILGQHLCYCTAVVSQILQGFQLTLCNFGIP